MSTDEPDPVPAAGQTETPSSLEGGETDRPAGQPESDGSQAPRGSQPDKQDSPASRASGTDAAKAALVAARAAARARRAEPSQRQARRRTRAGPAEETRTGAGPDDRDPQPLASAIGRLISQRGWEESAAVGGVRGRWEDIVGTELAAHCRPADYSEGVLNVVADSTAWATQVRLLASVLVRRLNEELGHGTVTKVIVHGPGRGYWKRAPLTARDGRGPRDTFG